MVLIFNTINFYINWLTVTKLGQATVAVAKEMAPHIRKHGQKLLPDSIKSKTPAPGSNSKVDKVVDGAVEVAASGLKGKWLKSIISTSISCGIRICVYCGYIASIYIYILWPHSNFGADWIFVTFTHQETFFFPPKITSMIWFISYFLFNIITVTNYVQIQVLCQHTDYTGSDNLFIC